MQITILRPSGAGDITELFKQDTSGSNYEKVDEVTADDNTTYVYCNTAGTKYDLYKFPSSGIPSNAIIQYVRVYYRFMGSNSAGAKASCRIKTNGTVYNSTLRDSPASYTDYYDEWTTNPYTGVAWSVSEINAIQAGPYIYCYSGSYYARTTQLYIKIGWDYGPISISARAQLIGMTW